MKKVFSLLFVLSILFASCEEWIDPEINVDPDNPKDVSIGVLLPAIEGSLAYYYGGIDVVGIQSVWMQQLRGQDRQFVAINNYNIRTSDPNNLWNSLYQGVMMDIEQMIVKAEDPDNLERNSAGVAKVLKAVSLSLATDSWGSIPYTEAFLGSDELTPVYDDQQAIYSEIIRLLDDAIGDLESDENVAGITNDYIYGGDPAAWIRAAYSLKARFTMRLTEVSSVDYDAVIADLDNGFVSIDDDMEQPFDASSSAGYNPLYQFIEQRGGYIGNNAVYDSIMEGDPRNGIQVWSEDGFWSSQGSPVSFMGYTEALFLRAEAEYRNGAIDDAKTTLVSALESSMTKYNVIAGNESFVTDFEAEIAGLSGEDFLERLILEKYKHLFASPEVYNDWRRTGYPVLDPVQGTDIPKRYPYPQDEFQYNLDNVPEVNIYQRVWWDAD